ncbi:MAG TPA: hypothetical protein VII43_09500 [Opitutaceae bacterium]
MRALYLASLLVAAAGFSRAPDTLADALAARALLGPDVWARVVRIENLGNHGFERRLPYPSTTYALVFEYTGILWFYCDEDGTQSLSLRLGSLEADKSNPGPLLRAISPRFVSWEWAGGSGIQGPERREPPANGCFIECLAVLRERAAAATEPCSPSLLFFYVDTPAGRLGHTVLLLQDRQGLEAVDPDRPESTIRVPALVSADARSVAQFLRGGAVASARELTLQPIGMQPPGQKWTTLSPAGIPAG